MIQRRRGRWWVEEEEKEVEEKEEMRHVAAFVLPRHAGIISPPSAMHHPEGAVFRSGLDTRERKRGPGGGGCTATKVSVCCEDFPQNQLLFLRVLYVNYKPYGLYMSFVVRFFHHPGSSLPDFCYSFNTVYRRIIHFWSCYSWRSVWLLAVFSR